MNDLARFDLNLLVLFEALLQERSVSAAAKRLRLGQPATSAALARLRRSIGDELFVRTGGTMRPTPRALELAKTLNQALAEIRSALNTASRFDPMRSNASFTVAHTDYTALVTLPHQAESVRAAAPGVKLYVVGYDKGEIFDSLGRMEIDVAVGVFPNTPAQIKQQVLYQDSFVGVASSNHPLFRRKMITAELFTRYPHALVTVKRDATGFIDHSLAAFGLTRRTALTTPFMFALGAALPGTDLVATLPRRAADRFFQQGLRLFELPFATEPWNVSMLWNAANDSDPAHIWLRQTFAASSSSKANVPDGLNRRSKNRARGGD